MVNQIFMPNFGAGAIISTGLGSEPNLKAVSTRESAHAALLPEGFGRWFEARGWSPREHQLALLEKAQAGRSALLIAPTGAGKTLAGFLPTLVELAERAQQIFSPPSRPA